MYRSSLAGGVLALTAIHGAYAQNAKLDLNHVLAVYDLDRDGKISPAELAAMNRDLRSVAVRQKREPPQAALTAMNRAPGIVGARQERKVQQAAPPTPAGPPPNHDIRHAILLRDVYSVVAFISHDDEDAAGISKKGASFTATNDRIADTTTLSGKGAFIYALYGDTNLNVPGTVDARIPRMTHFSFVPGLEWDIKSKNGRNTGSVSGRAGLEFETQQGPPFTTQYWRANAIYTTDLASNDAQVYGVEASWMPVSAAYAIGVSRRITRDLDMWVKFVPTLNSDYYHVGDPGTFTDLTNHDYWWVGPKLQADLFFGSGPLEGFNLYAKYFYLKDLLNGGDTSVDYLQTGLQIEVGNWDIEADPTRKLALGVELRYTKGKTPRTLERTDEVFAGLTVKLGDLPR